MVTIFTVENAKDVTTAMRGNFIKIVDKKTGDVSITFLNGKGKLLVTMDYDVQAAVMDLHKERDYQMVQATTYKAAARGLEEKIAEMTKTAAPPAGELLPEKITAVEPQDNDSIRRFIVNARIIKGLFVEAR